MQVSLTSNFISTTLAFSNVAPFQSLWLALMFSEVFVDPALGDDSNDGTETSPVQTIQAALNLTNNTVTNTVWLQPGIYSGNGNTQLTINRNSVHFRNTDVGNSASVVIELGSSFWLNINRQSRIPGTGQASKTRELTFHFQDLFVRNPGQANPQQGAGIRLFRAFASFRNCIFTGNTALFGHVKALASFLTFHGCIFEQNFGSVGQITLFGSLVFMNNSIMRDNFAQVAPACIAVGSGILEVSNSIFERNVASQQTVFRIVNAANVTISDCMFRGNLARGFGGVLEAIGCQLTIRNAG